MGGASSAIEDGLSAVGNGITSGLTEIGKGTEDVFKDKIGGGLQDAFTKDKTLAGLSKIGWTFEQYWKYTHPLGFLGHSVSNYDPNEPQTQPQTQPEVVEDKRPVPPPDTTMDDIWKAVTSPMVIMTLIVLLLVVFPMIIR